MEEHYEFQFFEDPLNIEDVRLDPPATCLHPIKNCHSSLLYRFIGTRMHRQRVFVKQFQAELLQVDSGERFSFRYRTDKNRLFILFCLRGDIRFATLSEKTMTVARKGYFYVSRNSPGIYNVHCRKKGTSLALAISIDPKWARRKVKNYPRLKEALNLLMESNREFGVMAHCEIDDEVSVWLRYLQLFANSKKRDFRRMLRSLVEKALTYYESLLEHRSEEPIYRVKAYIDRNFMDPYLSVQFLCGLFPFEERTLRKKFVMEFHVTPMEYLTTVRLTEAKRLIDQHGYTLANVWQAVGYNDLETFRQAYGRKIIS
ncbi:helix-turn-helix domain-containing protein [Sphingobacterium kyonggiense]